MRVKSEARREAILEVASQVFRETGYERASMAEISARVGGSKATLYSYFPSKDALFLEVTLAAGREHMEAAFSTLKPGADSLDASLRRFGEHFLAVAAQPEFIAGRRIVIAEAGRSDIGRGFYDAGPKIGEQLVADFLQACLDAGQLRPLEVRQATLHLMALLEAEIIPQCLYGLRESFSPGEIKEAVGRAVSVFVAAYGA